MTLLQAIILGLIQGLTEFLPISSTAHLVLIQNLFKLTESSVIFDVALHLATALATIIVLWPEIKKINLPLIRFIFLASLPTVVLGLWLKQWDQLIFGSLLFSAVTLILNGFLLLLPKYFKTKSADLNNVKSFKIGIAQGIAILPGISRSGATIVVGLLQGLSPAAAYNFSFLISLPAILGAQLLSLKDLSFSSYVWSLNYSLGFLTAFLTGIAALWWLKKIVSRGNLTGFAYYCLIVGGLMLLL